MLKYEVFIMNKVEILDNEDENNLKMVFIFRYWQVLKIRNTFCIFVM